MSQTATYLTYRYNRQVLDCFIEQRESTEGYCVFEYDERKASLRRDIKLGQVVVFRPQEDRELLYVGCVISHHLPHQDPHHQSFNYVAVVYGHDCHGKITLHAPILLRGTQVLLDKCAISPAELSSQSVHPQRHCPPADHEDDEWGFVTYVRRPTSDPDGSSKVKLEDLSFATLKTWVRGALLRTAACWSCVEFYDRFMLTLTHRGGDSGGESAWPSDGLIPSLLTLPKLSNDQRPPKSQLVSLVDCAECFITPTPRLSSHGSCHFNLSFLLLGSLNAGNSPPTIDLLDSQLDLRSRAIRFATKTPHCQQSFRLLCTPCRLLDHRIISPSEFQQLLDATVISSLTRLQLRVLSYLHCHHHDDETKALLHLTRQTQLVTEEPLNQLSDYQRRDFFRHCIRGDVIASFAPPLNLWVLQPTPRRIKKIQPSRLFRNPR